MRATHVIPDINFNPYNHYTKVADQSIPDNWILQAQKLDSNVATPSEIP